MESAEGMDAMSEPRLISESPIPNTNLTAQWWELDPVCEPGKLELLVQRPPCGESRDRPFRWILAESELDILYRHLCGDDSVKETADRLMSELLDSLLVGVWILRRAEQPPEVKP
jgi:hypothetical protein